jgi:hypothetical protein
MGVRIGKPALENNLAAIQTRIGALLIVRDGFSGSLLRSVGSRILLGAAVGMKVVTGSKKGWDAGCVCVQSGNSEKIE